MVQNGKLERTYISILENKKHRKMKNIKFIYSKTACLLGVFFIALVSCERELSSDLKLAGFSNEAEVFIDGFSGGLDYFPFEDSKFTAFSVDKEVKHAGTASMRFDVPNVGDLEGAYAGAIFKDATGRDLTGYDALTFWAKGSYPGTINEIGFGQDFEENKHQAVIQNLKLTTNWVKYIIPLPDASKLTQEKGMLWYAEGPEDGNGYSFWLDDVKFEKLGTNAHPRPAILGGKDVIEQSFIGAHKVITGLTQTINLGSGIDQTVVIAASYFTFSSSNESVATVDALGQVILIGTGTVVITATLGEEAAVGSLTLESLGDFNPAPVPTRAADNVISIFSNAYVNEPVDYYNGYWAPYQTTQGQNDININGDDIIAYSELNFVGIQFAVDVPTINISQMTHFHVDIQVKDAIEPGDYLTVRLADLGADNAFGGDDDTSGEITLTNTTLVRGNWVSLDIPLSDLMTLTGKSNLGQVVFVSDATISNIFVDNVYFYKLPTAPAEAAPTPLVPEVNVISVFSDAYTNISGSDLNPDWGQETVVTQTPIGTDNALKYTGLNYQGLELGSSQDVTGMTHLHIDYYSANSTALNAYVISTGAVEKAKALTVPTTSGWVSLEIPLTDFSPVDLADIIQIKFDGNGDIYLDNIYFHN